MEQKDTTNKKMLGVHYRAVELRYEGLSHKQIAEILATEYPMRHPPYERVRRWFCADGILEKLYSDYARKENDRRRNHIRQRMYDQLEILPNKFTELLSRVATNPFTGEVLKDEKGTPISKSDMTTVAALKLMAELMGFKVEAMDNSGGDEDPVDRYFRKAKTEVKAPDAE